MAPMADSRFKINFMINKFPLSFRDFSDLFFSFLSRLLSIKTVNCPVSDLLHKEQAIFLTDSLNKRISVKK